MPYEIVGYCPKTGRPYVAPIAWSHPLISRPRYATCLCCPKKS